MDLLNYLDITLFSFIQKQRKIYLEENSNEISNVEKNVWEKCRFEHYKTIDNKYVIYKSMIYKLKHIAVYIIHICNQPHLRLFTYSVFNIFKFNRMFFQSC